ncbi:MAG: 3-deoxy-D-manno-octulosonic acid transferase [Holophagae bacterium]|jgi:3-deoxy-D-manno-octulosonic-acid transferase
MIWLYRALLTALLPIAVVALAVADRIAGKRRPRWADRLLRQPPDMAAGGLWLHAVSVGEVEIARRLVAEIARAPLELPVVVTATTATGLDLARRTMGAELTVLPCPLDLPGPVGRLLGAARPREVAVVETELWPEMLYQAGRRGIPVAVINARLSDASYRRYRRVRWVLAPLLEPISLVLARSGADAERFTALGVPLDAVRVTGNIKYDLEVDSTPLPWADDLRAAAGDRPILVAGSTMEGEEAVLLEAVARLAEAGRPPVLVLAPRHPERFDPVADLVTRSGLVMTRRRFDEPPVPDTTVFLLDTIGELARAYGLATMAFIGGSLVPTGGHNPLEPAVWGVPVVSGRHVDNFDEVYGEMVGAGAAVLVDGVDALTAAVTAWIDDPVARRAAGDAGRRVVDANRGATGRTVAALVELAAQGPQG